MTLTHAVEITNPAALATAPDAWQRVALRWALALERKSPRTKAEYLRYVRDFLASIDNDPGAATPGAVYDFAYRTGVSGKPPSPLNHHRAPRGAAESLRPGPSLAGDCR